MWQIIVFQQDVCALLRDELGKSWVGCVMGRRLFLEGLVGPFCPLLGLFDLSGRVKGAAACCVLIVKAVFVFIRKKKTKNSSGAEEPSSSSRRAGLWGGHCAAPWAQWPSCLPEEPLPRLQGPPAWKTCGSQRGAAGLGCASGTCSSAQSQCCDLGCSGLCLVLAAFSKVTRFPS